MTDMERTDRMLLEVVSLRTDEPNRKQFSSLELQRYLASHNVELTVEGIEATLHGLARLGAVRWSVTDDIRYRITSFGHELLRDLQAAAQAEAEVA